METDHKWISCVRPCSKALNYIPRDMFYNDACQQKGSGDGIAPELSPRARLQWGGGTSGTESKGQCLTPQVYTSSEVRVSGLPE